MGIAKGRLAASAAVVLVIGSIAALVGAAEVTPRPLVIHVKTALSVDDAQICAVPNVAWAALSEGREVTLVFDASGVTSVANGFGWRGWLGWDNTAMDRAGLPERERKSLAEQFGVSVDSVPRNYGDYLRFLKGKGAKLFYNRTMAVLYNIDPERIDPAVEPLDLKAMLGVLASGGDYLVY